MADKTSYERTSKAPYLETGDENTAESTAAGNTACERRLVKVEETLENAVYVEPSGTDRLYLERRLHIIY